MLRNWLVKVLFLLILLLGVPAVYAQETVVYRNAVNLTDPAEKIEALHKFLKDYPESNYVVGAKYYLFYSYMELGKVDSALIYAGEYTNAYPEGSRIGPYNDIASVLAEKKAGLDIANIYSAKAVEMARSRKISGLSEVLDTRASILNLLGKPDSALALENEAITGNETNPDFLSHLAIFQFGSGKKIDAIKTAARAILMGNTDDALSNFNNWITEVKPEKRESNTLRENIVKNVLNEYLKTTSNENTNAVKSTAAVFLANTLVNLDEAGKYAKEALNSLNNNSLLDDKILFTKNYSIVLSAENKEKEAIKELTSIEMLVDPWDTDFWYTLGKAYEKTGNKKKAEDAFFAGVIAYPAPKLMNALESLSKGKTLDNRAIQKRVESEKEKLADFEPGHYKIPSLFKGKVVLAELFTGAECPPCAGADYAYDALSKYYPRNILAILEYHVHIPSPDPMTNPQTFQRYMYYGGNFGTPTAFIEGTEKIVGGGPKFLMPNRFHVYQYAINKFLNQNPLAELAGTARLINDAVKISVQVKAASSFDKNVTLHIALAEKSINYPGGNGVNKHIFVVRALAGGANGLPLNFINNTEKTEQVINVNEVEKGLTEYLNDPTKDPSWRKNVRFTGWRQRPDKIDRNNLAVVIWLQNNLTKQIIQAYYMDVEK